MSVDDYTPLPPVGSTWTERPPYNSLTFTVASHDAPPDARGRKRVVLDRGYMKTKARADRFHGGRDYRPVNDKARAFVEETRRGR